MLNHVTASGHMSVLDGGLTVNTHTSTTELEVVGNISASSGNITGNNITAANQLDTKYRRLDITNSSLIDDYNGDVVFFGGEGTSFTQGCIHGYDGTNWNRVASNGSSAAGTNFLAIALGSNASDGMLIRGFYTRDLVLGAGGSSLYLGLNGTFNDAPPTGNGDYSRIVGHLLQQVGSNALIYFNPSPDWIEIEV